MPALRTKNNLRRRRGRCCLLAQLVLDRSSFGGLLDRKSHFFKCLFCGAQRFKDPLDFLIAIGHAHRSGDNPKQDVVMALEYQ